MLVWDFFYIGALLLCWTRRCESVILTDNLDKTDAKEGLEIENVEDTSSTMASPIGASVPPHLLPCFVDDILAALREGVGDSGEISNHTLSLFGVCARLENLPGSILSKAMSRNHRHGLEMMHLSGGFLVEEEDGGALRLTFDLPHSPLLKRNAALLLAFDSPLTLGDLDVSFSSHSLHPQTQSVCISEETQYLLLAGKESEGKVHHKWSISAQTNSPVMNRRLKDLLTDRKSESNISMTPLLFFSVERGSDMSRVLGQNPSHTSSFLCELRRFMADVLHQEHPVSHPVQLNSLQSLPPLTLGLSSTEIQLARLINSSTVTIFLFSSWGSKFHMHNGELALSPALLEELRERLEQKVVKTMAVIRNEDLGHRATERLVRLRGHSVFPKEEPATGESQFCAFLLLKALQTVARVYEEEKRLRSTRAGSSVGLDLCQLRSLTMSLQGHLATPQNANIKNCQGSCAVLMNNTINHVALLNYHIGRGNSEERAPCCVPLVYEPLEVVVFNGEQGTLITERRDIVAKECGCR